MRARGSRRMVRGTWCLAFKSKTFRFMVLAAQKALLNLDLATPMINVMLSIIGVGTMAEPISCSPMARCTSYPTMLLLLSLRSQLGQGGKPWLSRIDIPGQSSGTKVRTMLALAGYV